MGDTFTHLNEGFLCEHCGKEVPAASGTCRNHCTFCLHSKHVDIYPGDRAEMCHGLLIPVGVEMKQGSMKNIFFQCEKCGKESKNKVTLDDDREALLSL